MAETDAEKIAMCNTRAGRGAKITYHSGDPGTTGANLITTTPTSATTTWGSAAMSGSDAVAVGSQVSMTVPASTNVTYYGVWNGSTFLRGKALDSSVSIGSGGSVPVAITPSCKYTGNT